MPLLHQPNSAVSHPEDIWGQHFQVGVWSTFLNTLMRFQPHCFNCIRCCFEQNVRKLIVYLRNLSDSTNFIFLFFILGTHNVLTLAFSVQIRPCSSSGDFLVNSSLPGKLLDSLIFSFFDFYKIDVIHVSYIIFKRFSDQLQP